jgi:sialic acid synthase SpsE
MAIIIAECCQNHKGDLGLLKEMIWAAAEAGADYAKIQSMLADELTYRERFEEGLSEDGIQKAIKRPYQPEYGRLKPMDLDDATYHWFIEECQKAGIKPLTTVFTRSRNVFLASLPWREFKVASYDCASYPLLRDLTKHSDHLYISTGATYDAEVEKAAQVLGRHSYTFLHCVTIYPTPLEALNLRRMEFLRQFTPSVGFSDHSLVARDGLKAALVALRLGADVVERHFTLLPPDATKDGPVSINAEQLRALVSFAHMPQADLEGAAQEQVGDYRCMLGSAHRKLSPDEELNRDYYRGRFASRVRGRVVYNWEELPIDE